MLIPNKEQIYSKKWKPLGQRKAETSFLIPFNNKVIHQCRLTWEIREDMETPSWMLITSEKVLGLNGCVLPTGGNTENLRSIDPAKINGESFTKIGFMSSSLIEEGPLTESLIKAGILSRVSDKDGRNTVEEHVKNIEMYIDTGSCDNLIQEWIEGHSGVGSSRIKPRQSLFTSNLDIFSCSIM